MSKVISMGDPAFHLKKIKEIQPDPDGGWLVTFSCGHTVCWAGPPTGPYGYCGLCIDNRVTELRNRREKYGSSD